MKNRSIKMKKRTGHYKDTGVEYAYERKLRGSGYRLCLVFANDLELMPNKFENYAPKTIDGWIWRRAIKKYLENETNIPQKYNYKIVKAVGFWRDIYPLVYEVWIKGKWYKFKNRSK